MAIPGKYNMLLKRLLAATALAVVPAAAQAQSVKHAELEQLFGELVTTSVAGKPQRASEAAGSIVIITRDEIRRFAADNIPGLLKAHAGIDVVRWTAGQTDVALRGGVRPNNPSLLVLVNGRQVYLDHYGITNWNGLGLQLEEIQQIEVVKGPNSALFGFNAATGVINIITVNPPHTRQATATAVAGNEGRARASATMAAPIAEGRLGLRLSAGFETADELDALKAGSLTTGAAPVPDAERKEGSGELYARLDDVTEAVLSGTLLESTQETLTPLLLFLPQRYKTSSIGARLSRDMGWGMLSAQLYRNELDLDVDALSVGRFSRLLSNSITVASGNLL